MKFTTILIASLIMTSVMCADGFWGFPEEDDVIVLTSANFDEAVKKHDHMLVEFYAPWCGHCKKLAPEYSQAAAELKKTDPPVPVAKVDADAQKELGQRFGVQGFPTLKWFYKGQESEYKGGRTKAEIVQWVTKKTGPPTQNVHNAETLNSLKNDNKVLVVFHGEEGAEFETFKGLAASTEGVAFAHSFDAGLNADAPSKVVLYKQFDERQNNFEGAVESEALKTFVDTNRHELVMPFEGEEPIKRIFQEENTALVLFSDKSGDHETAFTEFAGKNRGRVVYALSRTNDGLGQRLAEYVGVKTEQAPCVKLIQPAGGDLVKYDLLQGEITVESLEAYMAGFESGSLTKHHKSAEVPATNDEPVKVVVGKNFDDLVTNSGKDVLLEFYAPWCGHCKTLAPKYDEAAKKVAHLSDHLTLAKIDATENEVPGVAVTGFPTLKFFKAGNPTPVEFDGPRETDGIVDWLKKNVTFEWKEAAAEEGDL